MRYTILILFILLAVSATAQLDWSVTDLRCGDGVLDKYEMCEKGVAENRCEHIEEMLGIDTACYTQHCTCLPIVNTAFCGNDKREGVELCDGTAEDFCPELGEKMNLTLKCNTKCGCDIVEEVPDDYNPEYIQQLEQKGEEKPTCGDKKVEGAEQCDPPGVLCTTNLDEAGKCSENCTCVKIETDNKANETKANQTEANKTVEKEENQTTGAKTNETTKEDKTEKKEEKEGFFSKFWKWFVSIFS